MLVGGHDKVLVAMSGGVDSSVALFLLQQQGYDCIGVTMRLHGCSSEDTDIADAKKVAARLGIPHMVVDCSDAFDANVVENFVDCYMRGETPNPCVVCNRTVKFGALMDVADEMGCAKIASGHYAVASRDADGTFSLHKGKDVSKDQSYMLHGLNQAQLSRVILPLGDMTKDDIRSIADDRGFENAHKADSQDICFIPDGDYVSFLEKRTGRQLAHGEFVDANGNILGEHQGIARYTIGQRKGLGLSFPEPRYVVALSPDDNQVVVGRAGELLHGKLQANVFNWIDGTAPQGDIRCTVKTRYGREEHAATARVTDNDTVVIQFDKPQRALTPGQYAVLYDGDKVLGGGAISDVMD